MSAKSSRPRLWLVDGTANIYRAFFALRGVFTTRDGMPTNAVYGFTTMLRKVLKDVEPEYFGVCFDRSETTFRNEMYEEYKANRPETPEDLVRQVPLVKEVTAAHNIPVIELEGWEADDLIGTLARQATEAGFDVAIVASDKDLFQLVNEHVRVMNPHKDNLMMDAAKVKEIFGVRPDQVVDVLALMGDASDNIPGVPGIGEKGAKKLLEEYDTLDSLLSRAGEVKRKSYRESLQENVKLARLSQDLATVRTNAPIDFDRDALRYNGPDVDRLREIFTRLEFTSLLKDLGPGPSAAAGTYEALTTEKDVKTWLDGARRAGRLSFELETDSPEPMRSEILGVALAAEESRGAYVPVRPHAGGDAFITLQKVLDLLGPVLQDPQVDTIGHDIKFAHVVLRRHGIEPAPSAFDTMVAGYLLNPSRSHPLEDLAMEHLGVRLIAIGELAGTGVKAVTLDRVEQDRVAEFAGANAESVLRLAEVMAGKLREADVEVLFEQLEMPLLPVLAEMERAGVRIDTGHLAEMSARMEADMERIAAGIHEEAGVSFNINSPKQLGDVLFNQLGLAPRRRTAKTKAFSTSQQVLEDLAADHPICARILEWRSLAKLTGTYVDALPGLVHPETGRVHTRFNQTVAATGRLSSSDPNLQNIPIRSEIGREIRRAFIPANGHVLLTADYNQVELRVLAHLTRDPVLVDAFHNKEDIHARTAAEIFGVAQDLVTDEMRRRAKAVNFGILYGMGPQRLAREQGISMKNARLFIASYFARFSRVKEYIDSTIARVEEEGRVTTLLGRVRFFPEINSKNRMARQQALRAAVNTTIQGTAADLIKKAMIDIDRRLKQAGMNARMILQVHDELVLEMPEDEVDAAAVLVREAMENVHPLDVPLSIDLGHGPNWLEAKAG